MSLTTHTAYTSTDKLGAWAVATGSAVWGLFWIPLRYLDNAGINGLWAVATVMAAAFLPALIVTAWQRELRAFLNADCWLVGCAMGLSGVLYFTGVLYSDVIRVIFLFYLLPLWTTLSAWIIYGEPIRRAQLIVIAAALTGVWLLLGGGTALPIPQNAGDWCGIGAGLCWGVSLSLLRAREQTPPFCSTSLTFLIGCVLATLGAVVLYQWAPAENTSTWMPSSALWLAITPLALLFGFAMLYPALLGQIWGARRIPAPTAALLTMTEIIVATLSAGLLIGTELMPISLLGGAIIIVAVCIDLGAQKSN